MLRYKSQELGLEKMDGACTGFLGNKFVGLSVNLRRNEVGLVMAVKMRMPRFIFYLYELK